MADLTSDTLTLDEYQRRAGLTAVYPGTGTELPIYPALGLAGETSEAVEKMLGLMLHAGKFSEAIKKGWRDDNLDRDAAVKELGDVLWYVAMCAEDLGVSLGEVGVRNIAKLSRRQAEGTLHGSGDER